MVFYIIIAISLWTLLWTNYGLYRGLDGLLYGLSMDYTVDCLWTGIGMPWTILGTYSRDYLGTCYGLCCGLTMDYFMDCLWTNQWTKYGLNCGLFMDMFVDGLSRGLFVD